MDQRSRATLTRLVLTGTGDSALCPRGIPAGASQAGHPLRNERECLLTDRCPALTYLGHKWNLPQVGSLNTRSGCSGSVRSRFPTSELSREKKPPTCPVARGLLSRKEGALSRTAGPSGQGMGAGPEGGAGPGKEAGPGDRGKARGAASLPTRPQGGNFEQRVPLKAVLEWPQACFSHFKVYIGPVGPREMQIIV